MEIEIYRKVTTLKTEEEIEAYADILNKEEWSEITGHIQEFSFDFIRKFSDQLNWESVSYFSDLSFEFVKEFHEKLDLSRVFYDTIYTETIFNEDFDLDQFPGIDSQVLRTILTYQSVSEGFLEKYAKRFDDYHWYIISRLKISKRFRKKYEKEIKKGIKNTKEAMKLEISREILRKELILEEDE